LADVLAQLVREGIKFSQFRELQADLEDTFLTITRQTDVAEGRDTASATGEGRKALAATGSLPR
jgi:hypothetical protein